MLGIYGPQKDCNPRAEICMYIYVGSYTYIYIYMHSPGPQYLIICRRSFAPESNLALLDNICKKVQRPGADFDF